MVVLARESKEVFAIVLKNECTPVKKKRGKGAI